MNKKGLVRTRKGFLQFVIVLVIMAVLPSFAAAQPTIQSVSPSTATTGDTLTVTITIQGDIPPADARPNSVKIGTVVGTNITWNGTVVTAAFTIPASEAAGTKDVAVEFPAPGQSVTVTKTGGFQVLSGSSGGTGSLKVTLSPSDAVNAGAKWQVDGGSWQASEATVSDLSAGTHTVAFGTVSGWTAPSGKSVTITSGQTANLTGTYTQGTTEQTLSYPIADTGQTKCYNASTEMTCPSSGADFYGQDAQYAGNQPSCTLSSDGKTVYDNVTKLTWMKGPNTTLASPVSTDKKSYTAAQAWVATVNNMNYGGFGDWRLPTIKELYSLIKFNGTDPSSTDTSGLTPFIDTAYFNFAYGQTSAGERIIDSQYASSNEYVFNTESKVLSAPPNILFVVDNSASMDGSFMTKETGGQRVRFPALSYTDPLKDIVGSIRYVFDGERYSESGDFAYFYALPDRYRNRWQTQYYGFNKMYYNPGIEYTPWPGKEAADLNTPKTDPAKSTTINLSAKYTKIGDVEIPNAHYYVCASDAVYLVIINNNAISYYQTDAPRNCSDLVYSATETVVDQVTALTEISDPPDDVLAKNTDGTLMTYEEARQNFANWFTYYHKRILTAKASLGKVISNMSSAYIGLMDIFFTTKKGVVPVKIAGEEDKTAELLSAAYSMEIYGGTPLRDSLNKAGQYFDAGAGGNTSLGPLPYVAADKGGASQQNFIILMTDGAYNETELSVNVGNADSDGDTAYDGSVFGDSYSNTLADVAMKYYENDLAPDLENLVPANAYDSATHQHVVTYTVAFGVTGTLAPNDECPETEASCPSWPDPAGSGKDFQKIDDLWHTAVNGRGKFVSAASSDELVAALMSLLDDIGKRAGYWYTKLFGVNFADGRIKGYDLTMPGGSEKTFFVQLVRGNTGYGINSFEDNGDQTITDKATGLMWSKADSGSGLNWQEALAYIQTKNDQNYLGHNDWRLPNAKELHSILDYTRSPDTTGSAAIDPVFGCTKITNEDGKDDYPWYWASTTHATYNGMGAGVYIAFGRAGGWQKADASATCYTLYDVHGAGAQRSDPKTASGIVTIGTACSGGTAYGLGPQGDSQRASNYVRLVRDAELSADETSSLTVTISPATAVSAGAQWQIDGGEWQDSGSTVSDLSVGNHTVTFSSVSGWTAPSEQTVTIIVSGQTVTVSETYTETCIKGNIDGIGDITLADFILALKALGDINSSGIFLCADVNNDGKIGIHEAVYILRKLSEIGSLR